MLNSLAEEKLKIIFRDILISMGIPLKKHKVDRFILEEVIFPYFVTNKEFIKILFVGCAWYTKAYNLIFKNKDYQTIDPDPGTIRFGSKKHIIDSVENICNYYYDGELDLIICNGVWGWGLNEKSQSEKAFLDCYKCLRNGGVLILGWNDISDFKPFPLEELDSLKLFQPLVFAPLSGSQYLTTTPYKHTFNFYEKVI